MDLFRMATSSWDHQSKKYLASPPLVGESIYIASSTSIHIHQDAHFLALEASATILAIELTFKPSSQRSGNSGSSSVRLDHLFKETRLAHSQPTIWISLGMWTINLFPPCPKYWLGYGYSGTPCIVQMSFHSSATVTYEWIAPIHVLCSESAFTQTL